MCNKIIEGEDYRPNEDVQGAGSSDGEYQIYEQDSDDDDNNYLDDEDADS